jgi:hypothetical protein
VRVDVRVATDNKQIPWENTSLEHDFYFIPPSGTSMAAASPVARPDSEAMELEAWNAVEKSGKSTDYQAYLERYPTGRHAEAARIRIAAAEPSSRASPSASRDAVTQGGTTPPPPPAGDSSRPAVAYNQPRQGRLGSSGPTEGFSFSAAEEKTRQEVEGGKMALASAMQTPCEASKKKARISVGNIGERYMLRVGPAGPKSGGAFAAGLVDRLRRAGLNAQLGGKADYYLSGSVTTESGMNRMLRLNEVSLTAALYLSSANGSSVAEVVTREDSFAGDDTSSVLVDLMRRQADAAAAKLYTDFCRAS